MTQGKGQQKYTASQLERTSQHLDEDEFLKVRKIPEKEIEQMILDNKINDGKTILALALAKMKKTR